MFKLTRQHGLHWWHYLVLIAGLALMIILYSNLYHQTYLAIGIIVLTTAFYLSWAIFHHHLSSKYHPRVFLEYLLVALIGLGLAVSVILSL